MQEDDIYKIIMRVQTLSLPRAPKTKITMTTTKQTYNIHELGRHLFNILGRKAYLI